MSFKVGDRVIIIDNGSTASRFVGERGIVTDTNVRGYDDNVCEVFLDEYVSDDVRSKRSWLVALTALKHIHVLGFYKNLKKHLL